MFLNGNEFPGMKPQYIKWYPKMLVGACFAMTGDVTFIQEPTRLKARGPVYIVGTPESSSFTMH